MERRLAAILAADMVGYSRLMEADEIGTLERQKTYRSYLNAKPKSLRKKSGRLQRTNQFQRVWTRWLNLSTKRKKQVAKKWGIQDAFPSQHQKEMRKVWNTLSPTKRQEFLHNLR